jgi:hypothetical protein
MVRAVYNEIQIAALDRNVSTHRIKESCNVLYHYFYMDGARINFGILSICLVYYF